jgi:hypothetical protein
MAAFARVRSLAAAASQAAIAGFAKRISSFFSSVTAGRILANWASAFAVKSDTWMVAIAPNRESTMYVFNLPEPVTKYRRTQPGSKPPDDPFPDHSVIAFEKAIPNQVVVACGNHCSNEDENQKGEQARSQHGDTSSGPGKTKTVFVKNEVQNWVRWKDQTRTSHSQVRPANGAFLQLQLFYASA